MARQGEYRRRGGAQRDKDTVTPTIVVIFAILILGFGIFSFWNLWKTDAPDKAQSQTIDGGHSSATAQQKGTEKVEEILGAMTLEEKAYQMLFVTPESITGVGTAIVGGEGTRTALEAHPVGGIVYFAKNIQTPEQIHSMLKNTQSYSEIPLFLGVDEEGGRVQRIASNEEMGVESVPAMQEIGARGDASEAYDVGETLSATLTELGFNVDFAPVADVLINEENSEIGDRSFGSDPQAVSKMVAQVVKGLQDNGTSAVLKHFPGHGSTSVDSHTGYSESNRTYEQLKTSEFLPFKAGIDAGVDFVMLSHMSLTNAHNDDVPASLSETVITDWLINELGFGGIVITDSFQMGAITEEYSEAKAVVMAIDAGADMILMPVDVEVAQSAIVQAVKDGKLTEERIDASIRKILTCKEKRGLLK